MFVTLIIMKFSTKYHYSSTIVIINRGKIDKNSSNIYQNSKHMFVTLIIMKFSTKYHYSSTIVNGFGLANRIC